MVILRVKSSKGPSYRVLLGLENYVNLTATIREKWTFGFGSYLLRVQHLGAYFPHEPRLHGGPRHPEVFRDVPLRPSDICHLRIIEVGIGIIASS